jgi:ATP-dependent RNA helicase DDX42
MAGVGGLVSSLLGFKTVQTAQPVTSSPAPAPPAVDPLLELFAEVGAIPIAPAPQSAAPPGKRPRREHDDVVEVTDGMDGALEGGTHEEEEEEEGAGEAAEEGGFAPLDASTPHLVDTRPLVRNVFSQHEDAAAVVRAQGVARLRAASGVTVSGSRADDALLAPLTSFIHLILPHAASPLQGAIAAAGYEAPTPIQGQVLPAALCGRDAVVTAPTGSGKTAAFVLPALVHVMAQRSRSRWLPLVAGGKPVPAPAVLIVEPTRELATQVGREVARFARAVGLHTHVLGGGGSVWEQRKALHASGADVVVCTPGRLVDHLKRRHLTLGGVSFLVLDEADRCLDLGFAPQVTSIVGACATWGIGRGGGGGARFHGLRTCAVAAVLECAEFCRPDRQTLLFSATMGRRVAELVALCVDDPLRIALGTTGAASRAIAQQFHTVPQPDKWTWLGGMLPGLMASSARVLVFVATRDTANELAASINRLSIVATTVRDRRAAAAAAAAADSGVARSGVESGPVAVALHGDMMQHERDAALRAFKTGGAAIMVATDVASRGLHIPEVDAVVNYDAAPNVDTHLHRVGRTGRMGADGSHRFGSAVTVLTPEVRRVGSTRLPAAPTPAAPPPPPSLTLRSKLAWQGSWCGTCSAPTRPCRPPCWRWRARTPGSSL